MEPKLEKRKADLGISKGARGVNINYTSIEVYIISLGYKHYKTQVLHRIYTFLISYRV